MRNNFIYTVFILRAIHKWMCSNAAYTIDLRIVNIAKGVHINRHVHASLQYPAGRDPLPRELYAPLDNKWPSPCIIITSFQLICICGCNNHSTNRGSDVTRTLMGCIDNDCTPIRICVCHPMCVLSYMCPEQSIVKWFRSCYGWKIKISQEDIANRDITKNTPFMTSIMAF